MGAQGQTTVDFGSFPGSLDAATTITGQGSIASNSLVEAWIHPIATADHTVAEHYVDAPEVFAGEITAGVGFVIRGICRDRYQRYGLWTVDWVWN